MHVTLGASRVFRGGAGVSVLQAFFAAEDNRYLAAAGSAVVDVAIITSDILFTTNAVSHGRARLQAGAPCGVKQQQRAAASCAE